MLNNEIKNNILKDIEKKLKNNRLLKDSLFRDVYMVLDPCELGDSYIDFGVRNRTDGGLGNSKIRMEYYLDEYDIEGVERSYIGDDPYIKVSYVDEMNIEYELYFKYFININTDEFHNYSKFSTEDAKYIIGELVKILSRILENEVKKQFSLYISSGKEVFITLPDSYLCGQSIVTLGLVRS